MIKKGSKVTIQYTLKVDGNVVESSMEGQPLSFVQGDGQIIPGVEQQLEGMDTGQHAEFTVAPEDGYGLPDPAAIHRVPKEAFHNVEQLKVGDVVSGEVGGRPFRARVEAIDEEEITLDLNHPLAGKTLCFEIEVVDVQH